MAKIGHYAKAIGFAKGEFRSKIKIETIMGKTTLEPH